MTLPPKEPKAYLEVDVSGPEPAIYGEPRHVAELEALFVQHGIPCSRWTAGDGREVLRLDPVTDLDRARELLDAYKNAKGS